MGIYYSLYCDKYELNYFFILVGTKYKGAELQGITIITIILSGYKSIKINKSTGLHIFVIVYINIKFSCTCPYVEKRKCLENIISDYRNIMIHY